MKSQLRKLADSVCGVSSSPGDEINVKEEGAYVNENVEETLYSSNYRGRGRGNYKSRGRVSSRGNRGYSSASKYNRQDGSTKVKQNPKDSKGNFTRCYICKSTYHWIQDCPHKTEVAGDEAEVHFTLFAKGVQETYKGKLLGETLGCAVLDSCCSLSVCGKEWLNCFLETIQTEERDKMEIKPSSTKFKFGTGDVVKSNGKLLLPAFIAGKKVNIETDIIDSDIPLLLSQNAMQKADTKIDFATDKISMFGKQIDLIFTSSGHYAIPVNDNCKVSTNSDDQPSRIFFTNVLKLDFMDLKEKQATAIKLHEQFSHASGSKLKKLIINGGVTDNE